VLSGAAQQLIQPDPPQHVFHEHWMVGLALWCNVGGRVNSGVMSALCINTKLSPAAPQLNDSRLIGIMREAG
jgi:hypothetical protein